MILSDGTSAWFRPVAGAELERSVRRSARSRPPAIAKSAGWRREHADEIERRYPKVLRRVGGYNLDEFVGRHAPFNLAKLIVGSEGTLGIVVEATVNLVPLPAAKAVLVIQFDDLLDALGATPAILRHRPSAVEVMDAFILNHTKMNADLHRLRQTFVDGEPAALLCVEFYGDRADELPPRLDALEADLRALGFDCRCHRAIEPARSRRSGTSARPRSGCRCR